MWEMQQLGRRAGALDIDLMSNQSENTYTTHLAFYTKPNEFFDPDFLDVTGIEFHGDSESAISFVI